MNHFEKDVQDKANDIVPSIVGFVASFGFFALIFIIANIVDVATF
ncbi:YqzM family protein [Shouchella sp. 1P09AA]|nr:MULTISPECIES: YqzM family protein [Bacillaceae]UTR07915.1 YqzM family protein [Alkalihalobacillus sp. LMS6]